MSDLWDELNDECPFRLMNNEVDWDELSGNFGGWSNHRDEYHIKFITSYLDKKYRRTSHSTCFWEAPWHGANSIHGIG